MGLTERDQNIPRKPVPARTPSAQPASRLPRRTATPSLVPSTPHWSSSVAERVAFAERAADQTHSPSETKGAAITNLEVCTSRQEVFRTNAKFAQNSSPLSPLVNKPLPHEKPLPPRPIVRLSRMPSPSKDSRGLIDAHDQPLHVTTPDGKQHEWPTLTPQSGRSPSAYSMDDPEDLKEPGPDLGADARAEANAAAEAAVTSSSLVAAAANLTNVINTKSSSELTTRERRSYSESSSYATANESPALAQSNKRLSVSARRTHQNVGMSPQHARGRSAQSFNDVPSRTASLRSRLSSGSLVMVTPDRRSKKQFLGFTDFTQPRSDTPASNESRLSPTNFSRPRPGSASSMLSGTRSIKTASRIPISDSKKATMVEVKKDRTSSTSTTTSMLPGPPFGSRRIASPDALKILEQGKLRRQMQLLQRGDSPSETTLQRVVTTDSEGSEANTPSLSHSIDTSPEGTFAPSSPESYTQHPSSFKPDTRSQQSQSPSDADVSPKPPVHTRALYPQLVGEDMFTDIGKQLPRAPPSTSPFTAPLQTIKSEAVLPTDDAGFQDAGFRDAGTDELVRTLSQLEGKGTPPKLDVDEHTLRHMFSHLKSGQDNSSYINTNLQQNAAAAEKFMAMKDGPPAVDMTSPMSPQYNDHRAIGHAPSTSHAHGAQAGKQSGLSKWSISTPSDNALSPPADGICIKQDVNVATEIKRTNVRRNSSKDTTSIGYPSCIPAKAYDTGDDDAAPVSSIASRRSSTTVPSLVRRKPGSVQAARQGLQTSTTPAFARTTAATQLKKTTKLPTPSSKAVKMPEMIERGRTVSSSHARAGNGPDNTRRSRSKSRLVLDKINGLFTGKRERKSEDVPPVPRIGDRHVATKGKIEVVTNTDPLTPAKATQLPKMPSLSPLNQAAHQDVSPTTSSNSSSGTVLVNSADPDDSTDCVKQLARDLIARAQTETNSQRKKGLLILGKALKDTLMSVYEAKLCAERAEAAAREAREYYGLTVEGMDMVQRMGTSMLSGVGSRK